VAEVYEDWVSETDVKYFAISIDDSRTSKRIKPMVDGKGWEFEILLDENSELKRAFGVSTVPYTVIVKNGLMVYIHTGYTPGYEDELYEQILKFSQ
jgi:peroxiredoxin